MTFPMATLGAKNAPIHIIEVEEGKCYGADRKVGNAPHRWGTPNKAGSPNAVEERTSIT